MPLQQHETGVSREQRTHPGGQLVVPTQDRQLNRRGVLRNQEVDLDVLVGNLNREVVRVVRVQAELVLEQKLCNLDRVEEGGVQQSSETLEIPLVLHAVVTLPNISSPVLLYCIQIILNTSFKPNLLGNCATTLHFVE